MDRMFENRTLKCYNYSKRFWRKIEVIMTMIGVSYSKLWKLLIDRKMKKPELKEAAKIHRTHMRRLIEINLFLWK